MHWGGGRVTHSWDTYDAFLRYVWTLQDQQAEYSSQIATKAGEREECKKLNWDQTLQIWDMTSNLGTHDTSIDI